MKPRSALLAGSVVGSVLASACCIGPVVLVLLGVSGAAAALRFEPFRPYLLAVTYGLLAGGFYLTYRPAEDCAPGAACETAVASRAAKALLWVSAFVVIVVTAFPWYSVYLF